MENLDPIRFEFELSPHARQEIAQRYADFVRTGQEIGLLGLKAQTAAVNSIHETLRRVKLPQQHLTTGERNHCCCNLSRDRLLEG
jgi:hypothetical protein